VTLRILHPAADSVPLDETPVTCEGTVSRLFEEARDDVYRYLLLLGLPSPQAQEATQEVFLRLYVVLRRGERVDNLRAWIFRVAHNHGLSLRSLERTVVALDPRLPDAREDPEQLLLNRERSARFHRAVAGLSEQQQVCLYLRAEGFRYREIADILGISDSTVGEFLRRAIARLRKALHV
jgi:RNA polymerase sigma-70 factor (ECF subfamily)